MEGSLRDFLNHGLLPFVGRAAEAERIVQFWSTTTDTNHLRAALMIGEAGIGKSRLVEEQIPRIIRAGGAVVHTKLYPESTASITPLIARALRLSSLRRWLQAGTPHESQEGVAASLRQLTRLRPTILIVEDVHLLSQETLEEFRLLLEALADDTLAVLAVARPIDLPARKLLAPYLVDEFLLPTLTEEHVTSILMELVALPETADVVRLLISTTRGNPLALRSAIRGMLRSGAIVYDPDNENWRVAIPLQLLTQTLRQNVTLLSEGMVTHLSDSERRGASLLSMLGEVFAVETAERLLAGTGVSLAVLAERGIVSRASAPAAPMPGGRSASPLMAFTHTILHTYLLQHATPSVESLIGLIADQLPFYSITPYQVLASALGVPALERTDWARDSEATQIHSGASVADASGGTAGIDTARRAILHSVEVAVGLDGSPDWRLGVDAWRAAAAIKERYRGVWAPTDLRTMSAEVITCRLSLLRRMDNESEFTELLNELLEMTEEPTEPAMQPFRLRALSFLHALERKVDPSACHATWERAQAFVARHPDLLFTHDYASYLESAARSMLYIGDDETLRAIELHMTTLAASPAASPAFRDEIRQILAFHCLEIFETRDELEARIAMLRDVEPTLDPHRRMSFLISKIVFMYLTGHVDEAIATADQAVPLFKELGLVNNFYYGSLTRASALAALGASLDDLEIEVEQLMSAAPDGVQHFTLFARIAMIELALHHGNDEWLRARLDRFADTMHQLRPEAQVILRYEFGVPLHLPLAAASIVSAAFRPIVEMEQAAEPTDRAVFVASLATALTAEPLRLSELLEKRAMIALARTRAVHDDRIIAELTPSIKVAIENALAWIVERKLPALARPLLEIGTSFVDTRELARWRGRIAELARERHAQAPGFDGNVRHRQAISMLGSVEFYPFRGHPIPVRGSRLRTLLGLLVANQLRHDPIPYSEFSTILAGTDDSDKARKTLNGVVFRLRELMGHDAIITDHDTPELNLEHLDVDLLTAHAAIVEADGALRQHALARAQRRVAQALDITGGKVAFPTLYEEFFEQARVEFEHELRTVILHVANELLANGNAASAEELLQQGFAAMAGDEELGELLCRSLELHGKHTEAERVRMRMIDRLD